MRVAVCINKLDDVTGTETYCLDLLGRLGAAGHAVDVFTLSSAPAIARRVAATGARLFTYPDYPPAQPDRAVVMHPLATTLHLRKIDRAVPTLALIHSAWADEYPVRMQRIDRFIAVSPFIADELLVKHGVSPSHVGVVANGVDTAHFDAPPVAVSAPVRALWASVYHPDRHDALVSVLSAVLQRDDMRLTVVDAHLPRGLVPDDPRIQVVAKRPDSKELIENADVVCALGPGRILLEALAMNRAALCLNVKRKGEYMDERNRTRLEYYFSEWGAPVRDLLTPELVELSANRRAVATRYYDKTTNFGAIISELEALRKRAASPLRYHLSDAKRVPYLARAYAVLLDQKSVSEQPVPGLGSALTLRAYRTARGIAPSRVRRALDRLAE